MGSVADFFRGIVKGTKIIAQKVGAFILFVFLLGMLVGGFVIANQLSPLWFVAFGIAVLVTWNDFGEGVGITALLLILLFLRPDVFPMINFW